MRTTKYLLSTLKKTFNQSQTTSYQLMLRAGIVRKLSSGLYSWLPNGIRVLNKIKTIIRKEMNKNNALEIIMPITQPISLWEKSNRIKSYGHELFKVIDRRNKKFILAPTHEELITHLIKNEIYSYKQLPILLYQIQTKFRDELRPQFGVIRSKEFIMKDAYSFHLNNTSLINSYNLMQKIYIRIFNKMNLKFNIVKADSTLMGGNVSHEFQVSSNIKKNITGITSTNIKHTKKNVLKPLKNIEIAHIFQVGKKYSKQMNVFIKNKSGKSQFLYMGCYGIGISRIIAAIIEQNHDNQGIIWPDSITPFLISIIPINMYKSDKVKHISEMLYNILKKKKIDVLIDDRSSQHLGTMISDIELIGIPHNIVISDKHVVDNNIEYFNRKNKKKIILNLNKFNSFIETIINKK